MKRRSHYFASFLLVAAQLMLIGMVASCSKTDPLEGFLLPGGGDKPKVFSTYPAEGALGLDQSQGLWVWFDREMDQQKTQSSFSVSSASGVVNGAFRWESTRMIFTPKTALTGSDQFTMTVSRSAEASTGINLESDYLVRFFATTDISKPTLLTSTPTNGATNVAQNQTITLTFSKPIDFSTISSGMTVSPAIVSTTTQNAAKDQIIITPSSNLTNGTTYTINLTTNLKDLSGNSLQQASTISFVVGSSFTPPSVLSATAGVALTNGVLTTNVDRTASHIIQFSQPMNVLSTENAITLNPTASVTRSWNATFDQLTLSYSPSLDPQTNYTLTISATATDSAGNLISTGYSYPLYTDAATSVRPLITSVRQENSTTPGSCAGASGAGTYVGPLTDYSVMDISQTVDVDPSPGTLCMMNVRIDFNNVMVRNSLINATSFTKIFDASPGNVQIYNIITPGPTTGNYMTLQLYGNPWPSVPGIPTYRLRITGGSSGAVDTNGNTMLNDYEIFLTL